MSGREQMLERIRKALGRPLQVSSPVGEIRPELGAVMPPIAEDLVSRFEAELSKVAGTAYRAATPHELEEIIRTILVGSQATAVVLSRNPLLAQLGLEERLRAWGRSVAVYPGISAATEGGYEGDGFREQCFSATVGITGADFVLAETGSLVLSSRMEGSQLVSLAPPVHVALYRRNQVFGSLEEVLEQLPVSRDPDLPTAGRSVVFISGTSRTADIEQILIRGVHGPGEVHAILVEEACLG